MVLLAGEGRGTMAMLAGAEFKAFAWGAALTVSLHDPHAYCVSRGVAAIFADAAGRDVTGVADEVADLRSVCGGSWCNAVVKEFAASSGQNGQSKKHNHCLFKSTRHSATNRAHPRSRDRQR